ncbi:MAG TPA: phosphohydrolase, partial [Mariniflexile sp.]
MEDFINKLYRNHSLIYKGLLFVCTTFLIVYLFPKSGKFKYNFEKGKPWQSENLYAPFNFAIKKSDAEIASEKQAIIDNSILYFAVDNTVEAKVNTLYKQQFKSAFSDSIPKKTLNNLYKVGQEIISEFYAFGVLNESYNFAENRAIAILDKRVKKQDGFFSDLIKQDAVTPVINRALRKHHLTNYKTNFVSLFFELIQPNLTFDKSFTEKAQQEELNKIAYARGSIEKETLIISKGEIIEGDKYQILKSLQSEYESQVWSKSNYNWIIFAYTLLVSLALLMLLLFLRKYRKEEVFDNNTKVTFIFFNIFLMIFITTLVVNYNSKFIYVVPICILPLIFKAFFDARLGLFAHVITVLLLGFIVPNSYEYMFLQIIAGI